MRAVLILAVLIAVMVLVGWIRFSSPAGNPTLEVDKAKIQGDTQDMVDSVKNVAERVDEQVERPADARDSRPVVITE